MQCSRGVCGVVLYHHARSFWHPTLFNCFRVEHLEKPILLLFFRGVGWSSSCICNLVMDQLLSYNECTANAVHVVKLLAPCSLIHNELSWDVHVPFCFYFHLIAWVLGLGWKVW